MTMTAIAPPAGIEFAAAASPEVVERTAQALRGRGFAVLVAADRAEAKRLALSVIPRGSEVHEGASVTLDQLGISAELVTSPDYEALRPRLWSMDRATQANEMRKLSAGPDVLIGSVHAITEDGQVLIGSGSGSQLAGYAAGAGQVVWVVGSQKIVPDLATAFRRIKSYVVPLEDERMQRTYGSHTALNKLLIVNGERPGRITVVLINDAIGF